tara:strand:- start:193 stop:2106 length:1914 start_codon:yes stop_codon:yes gene_type:complete
MIELRALLEEKQIRKAVVIDDVFDDAPRPDELDHGDWATFFDDLGNDGHDTLEALFPGYKDADTADLQDSQDFIDVIWKNRQSLPRSPIKTLFNDYESTNATERAELESLVQTLEGLGLTCAKMGRDPNADADNADLIVIDLFLGRNQSGEDMERAIQRARNLVTGREKSPPLVILTSRSPRLNENRDAFRDDAGLLGSTFRVVSKADLGKAGTLDTLLARLANHYEDAKRVAGFVHAWDNGLDQARQNFIRILRRLDLSDLAQVRTLLLDFEGQNLGDYLLDVADRVLQHEIEAEPGTIGAANELNEIELAKYPAPHLAGSPDLQNLVHRMIFQHVERLKLSFDGQTPTIQYGDVLQCKDEKSGTLTSDVFLVATPACDLVRGGTKHVLVLPGTLTPLTAEDWSYGATTITKTPIFASDDGSRHWIRWHLKDRQTIPLAQLRDGLQSDGKFQRLGRIRETYATEIQQRMLADMGRIGQPANPPATFPVSITLFAVSPDATTVSVAAEGVDTAVCFVGRNADGGRVDHLVLGEAACDALKGIIQDYSTDDVHNAARQSLEAMKADIEFFERFEKGLIEVPQKHGKWQEERGAEDRIYLHILRNDGIEAGFAAKGNRRNAPFVMKVSDLGSSDEQQET